MSKKNYIGALDIGSRHISFLLGEMNQQRLNLLGLEQIPSEGYQKSKIEEPKRLAKLLGHFFEKLSNRFSFLPEELCLSLSGSHLRNVQYDTSLQLKGFHHTVTQQDLDKINSLALHKELPNDEIFLHHFRQFYTINGNRLEQPLGIPSSQLAVRYNALLGKTHPIKEQLNMVNQFGFRVKHLVFSGLAAALPTTTKIERENGICVINIGAQMTEFVYYKHQIPLIMGTIPVGGQNFTYDLCSGLRIHAEDAERLKLEHGIPPLGNEMESSDIWVLNNRSIGDKKIKIKNFRTILHARAKEIFDYIYKFIKCNIEDQWLLPGLVLTGGGALLKNIEATAAQSLNCDCWVRGPIEHLDSSLKSPSYATCLGLLYYALHPIEFTENHSLWQRISFWFRKI